MFRNKLNEIAPVLENYSSPGRTAVKKYSYLSDIRKKKWEIVDTPYINEMINFLETENGNLGRRLLLATDSLNVAIKAMAYAKVHCDEYYEEGDTYYGYDCDFDFDEDEEDVSDVSKDDVVIFSGITDETDIKEKIDVICACTAIHVCVYIKPDLLDTWWAHTLLIDYRCEVLKLTTPGMEYYEKCVEALLNNEKIMLPKELSVNKIVQFAYKNKGVELKEKDVAWYMDKLLSKSLNMAAFENPMAKLEKMTGLENLKKVAIEMAAISKEELRNEKLGIMHKNMIFALYSKEVKAFLDLDCGLTSRINRFVKFDNYSLDELVAKQVLLEMPEVRENWRKLPLLCHQYVA